MCESDAACGIRDIQMEEKHLYGPVSKEADDSALVSWPDRHARR